MEEMREDYHRNLLSSGFAVLTSISGLLILLIFWYLEIPGKGIFTSALAMSNLVCLRMYQKIEPKIALIILMISFIIIQSAIIINISESESLDRGMYIAPIAIFNFLIFVSLLNLFAKFGWIVKNTDAKSGNSET